MQSYVASYLHLPAIILIRTCINRRFSSTWEKLEPWYTRLIGTARIF